MDTQPQPSKQDQASNHNHQAWAQNADMQEIDKFNALAEKWWDKNGAFKPLHDINPLRVGWIEKVAFAHFGAPLTGKKVLDVGCGGGILSVALSNLGADVVGIDLGAANIEAAKLHKARIGGALTYVCTAAEEFALQHAGQFDVVACLEMLEHVPSPQSVVDACFKLLKPNGILVLSTINRNAKSYLFAIIGAERVLKLLPKGTHDHAKFITPAELDKTASNSGLRRLDMTGLHYNPLLKKYWLADDVSVNYMMAFYKPEIGI